MNGITYPDQIKVAKRKTKNLSIRYALSSYDEQGCVANDVPPLEIPKFSRFIMSILNTQGGTSSACTGNIPQEDIEDINLRTENAVKMMMDLQFQKSMSSNRVGTENDNSEASKLSREAKAVRFNFPPELKGKGVIYALVSNQWSKVANQKSILQQNIAKYPANAKMISIIDEVTNLINMGTLSVEKLKQEQDSGITQGEEAASGASIAIYKTEMKYFSKVEKDGTRKVYQISVVCYPEKNYPFEVSITNAYGTVVDTETGGKNITDVKNLVTEKILLTEKEWVYHVKRMKQLSDIYEDKMAVQRLKIMNKYSYKPTAK